MAAAPERDPEAANRFARGLILALTLVLSCALGLLTPYLLAVIGILALAFSLLGGTYWAALREDRAAQLFLAVFLGLGICFSITARQPGDLVYALNFIMLVLYAPVAALMRGGAREGNAARFADLALAGSAVAFVTAAVGLFVFGWARAESPIFGAILLANTALLLGFLAPLGTLAAGSRRWLYLAGPVFGVAVVAMTGSRGPLLALVPLTLIAGWFGWRSRVAGPLLVVGAVAAFLALSTLMIVALESRSATLVTAIEQVLDDPVRGASGAASVQEEAADRSQAADSAARTNDTARIRLALYEAGLKAFLERPLFGHGWARLMSAAEPHLAPEFRRYATSLPQLHNDVLNFAVAAGLTGVILYAVLLATPLIAVLSGPRDRLFPVRFYGALVLSVAYLFDGLTDLMFGFEFHTAIYTMLTAILLGYCREPEAGKPGP